MDAAQAAAAMAVIGEVVVAAVAVVRPLLAPLRGGAGEAAEVAGAKPVTIGGRSPINSKYAGGTHPSGVEFSEEGFPNFSPHSVAEVELDGLTGTTQRMPRWPIRQSDLKLPPTDMSGIMSKMGERCN